MYDEDINAWETLTSEEIERIKDLDKVPHTDFKKQSAVDLVINFNEFIEKFGAKTHGTAKQRNWLNQLWEEHCKDRTQTEVRMPPKRGELTEEDIREGGLLDGYMDCLRDLAYDVDGVECVYDGKKTKPLNVAMEEVRERFDRGEPVSRQKASKV